MASPDDDRLPQAAAWTEVKVGRPGTGSHRANGRAQARRGTVLPRTPSERVDVSIVVPVFNESENLERLHLAIHEMLATLDRRSEVIFIDDGSTDDSYATLRRLAERDPRVKVIRFRRNFGQTAAFAAGFELARGATIVTLDADLQNDPADIPALLDQIDTGYDIVSGWRVGRQDALFTRRVPSTIANSLISFVTGVKLHDYGCSLKAYRREVVENIRLYGEMHRFIPAVASGLGVRIAEVPVHHSARQFGRSKYGISRTIRVLLDLLTVKFLLQYMTRPLHVFGLPGMVCLAAGIAIGTYLSSLRLFFGEGLADRPLLLLAVVLTLLGVQFIIMGLLGEVVVRTYYESQGKRTYAIRDVLGSDAPEPDLEVLN